MDLGLSRSEYAPDCIHHVPGIMNKTADTLSRKFEPGKIFKLPTALDESKEVYPPTRDDRWWKSLSPSSLAAVPS